MLRTVWMDRHGGEGEVYPMSAPRLDIGLGSFLVVLEFVVAVGTGSAIAVIPINGTYYACLTKKDRRGQGHQPGSPPAPSCGTQCPDVGS